MRVRNLAIGVAFFLGLVLAAAGAGELAARFLYRDVTTTSTAEGYFSRRWKREQLRRNAWGFREREARFRTGDDVYRIAVVGDSVTFGPGIPVEDRFTDLMAARLNAGGDAFDVLQFGAPGAELNTHVEVLKRFALTLKPHFVLLQWSTNDVGIPPVEMPKLRPLLADTPFARQLRRRSALYDVVNRAWRAIQLRGDWLSEYERFLRGRYGGRDGAGWRSVTAQLDRFTGLCERAHVEMGIVLFPVLTRRLADDYPYDFLHDQMLEECRERGIPCLDLRETFRPYADRIEEMWVNDFDHHPGVRAHRLAAERIVEFFGFADRAPPAS